MACPPESLWTRYGASLLSYSERTRLYKHCLRCKVCEVRRNSFEDSTSSGRVLDWASTRVAAGLVAVLVLAGATRLESLRRFRDYEFAAFAPVPIPIHVASGAMTSEEPATEEEDAEAPAETAQVAEAESERGWRDLLRPIGPYRPFDPPLRKYVALERTTVLDAPPAILLARMEGPRLPLDTPTLQPPRKHPLKRFVSVLAVPFRHL